MHTFILHTEIKWFENVSPWIVFDREKDIGGGKERGNPLWRTEGKHAANIWQANIFVGEKNHEASTVHLSRIVFLP